MIERRLSNVVGFDDAPFAPDYTGLVKIVGVVFAQTQLNGVLIGEVEKDGDDAAQKLGQLITGSKFGALVQLVMLQGIALAGFNVVDVFQLSEQLERPVLVVSRKQPDMAAIRRALLTQISDGARKWRIIERLGPMEPVEQVYVQRVGLSLEEAQTTINRLALYSHIPEPLRTAHLIAGALSDGQSRGRA